MNELPEIIKDESQLDSILTQPSEALRDLITQVSNPLVILGAGGKMGPTLAVLAKHAADLAGHPLEVIAVSRYSNTATRHWLENNGVKTRTADLFDPNQWTELTDSENDNYLVGQKFGTEANPGLTWALNTLVPSLAANRYRSARIVALSTGCVYPLVPVDSGGATEASPLDPPGEYATACLARERLLEYHARNTKHHSLYCDLTTQLISATACCMTLPKRFIRVSRSTSAWAISTAFGKAKPTNASFAA